MAATDRPTDVAAIGRRDVEAFISHLLDTRKPATAHQRFRGCQRFFNWLVEEGELTESPMARMRPPRLPETPPPVLRDAELSALLASAERGTTFEDRRDAAILRVLIDTSARRAEVAGLRWTPAEETTHDVDLEHGILRVTGKGNRERILPIGPKTIRALTRYLRVRGKHSAAALPWLWLGRRAGSRRDTRDRRRLLASRAGALGPPGDGALEGEPGVRRATERDDLPRVAAVRRAG